MTQVTNQVVLAEHTDSLVSTIQDLDPILSTLAGQRPLIEDMLTSINAFLTDIADNVGARLDPRPGPVHLDQGRHHPLGHRRRRPAADRPPAGGRCAAGGPGTGPLHRPGRGQPGAEHAARPAG